jgi:nucleotide-binding universal stress UspA family protein
MKEEPNKSVILWAVDPFSEETRPSPESAHQLSLWARRLGCQVQPVYLFRPMAGGRDERDQVQAVRRELEESIRSCKISTLPPQVLIENGGKTRLFRYGKQAGTCWIALSSHGRKGFKRLMLGSFAERLLQNSPWPVLFLSAGPLNRRPKILFPTNLSVNSRRVFRHLLSLGHIPICLFHSVFFPAPLQAMSGAGVYYPDGFFEEEKARARKICRSWAKEAGKTRVRIKVSDGGLGFLTGERILAEADKERVSLIVLHSATSAADRLFLGSAAFDVFRARRFPVLMFGPRALAPAHLRFSPFRRPRKPASGRSRLSL